MNSRALNEPAEAVSVIDRRVSISIIISIMIAPLLAAVLWTATTQATLVYWLTTVFALAGLRLTMLRINAPASLSWLLTVAAGLIWGAVAPLLLPVLNAQQQMLLILVLTGIAVGASYAYAGRMPLFYAFMLSALAPLNIWLFTQGNRTHITLSIVGLLYMLGLSVLARRNSGLLQAEAAHNADLQQEITRRHEQQTMLALQRDIFDMIVRHKSSLHELLAAIVQHVEAHRPGMLASVLLLGEEGKQLHAGTAPGLPDACWSEPLRDVSGKELGAFTMYYRDLRRPSDADIHLIKNVASLAGIAIENTRKQAESMLTLLQQAIYACNESIMILDAQGRIEFANPASASLYRRSIAQLTGDSVTHLRDGHEGDGTCSTIIKAISCGESWSGEISFHPSGGSKTLIARRISPIMDEQGHVHHQICIDRDITAEKKHSEQLEHTQRLESLGILAGGIAHDFNNLLTAIMGNAAIAERNMDDTAKAKPYLRRIEESSQRAADLCKQMLDYSGKGRFIIKPVNLSELIVEMTRLMEVSIEKNVVIRYDLSDTLPMVEVDTAQIQQVILNLITNASEAIGNRSGMISFATGVMQVDRAYLKSTVGNETMNEGEYVYMEVSDNGCGMDAATMEKMFDPFFTTKFTGRGLGMSALLGIVHGHLGAIRVYSEPERGTTFKVLLPVSRNQPAHSDGVADVNTPWLAHGTVLVVDDEETIREVATAMLEDMGFDIITAGNGKEAIELYRKRRQEVVVVLLDLTMPKMDGRTCLTELLCINPDVKVILSSGYSEEETDEQFASGILAGFIQKPYSPEALQQIMRRSLSESRLQNSS